MAINGRDTHPAGIWRRSSRCTPGKNCVELARVGRDVVVRDSKSTATLHSFDGAGWTTFLAHCRALD